MFTVQEFGMRGWEEVYASESQEEAMDWVMLEKEAQDIYLPGTGAILRLYKEEELIWQG